jgi:hypothetical protein
MCTRCNITYAHDFISYFLKIWKCRIFARIMGCGVTSCRIFALDTTDRRWSISWYFFRGSSNPHTSYISTRRQDRMEDGGRTDSNNKKRRLTGDGSIPHRCQAQDGEENFFSLCRIRVLDCIIKRKRQMSRGRTSFQALLKRAVDLTNWSFSPSLKSQHQNQRPQPRGFYSPSFSTFTPSLS